MKIDVVRTRGADAAVEPGGSQPRSHFSNVDGERWDIDAHMTAQVVVVRRINEPTKVIYIPFANVAYMAATVDPPQPDTRGKKEEKTGPTKIPVPGVL